MNFPQEQTHKLGAMQSMQNAGDILESPISPSTEYFSLS